MALRSPTGADNGWTDHGIQSDGWRLRARPLSSEEIEARERTIAARIAKPSDVPGGEWKPVNDGDGWSFWQEVPPKPGELKRQAYLGRLNNRGEWHSIDGSMPGQGVPFLATEDDRNLNEESNEQNQSKDSSSEQETLAQQEERPDEIIASEPEMAPPSGTAGDGAVDAVQPESGGESSGAGGVDLGVDEPVKIGEQPATDHQPPTTNPKVSKPKKARRSLVSKVLNFPMLTGEQVEKRADLLTGEQKKPKSRKQRASALLLTGEQTEDLKPFLPVLDSGFWWEAPADAKGFKIKLRWRDADKKQQCYVFRRLGKFELQTLRKGTYEEQRSDLADRLTGELIQNGRTELTARIKAEPQNHSRSAHPNSAIA